MNTKQDITETLQYVVDRALVILHADSIVLFTYENQTFFPMPTVSGKFFDPNMESFSAITKQAGVVDLSPANIYLESERDYLKLLQEISKDGPGDVSGREFWHREKTKSTIFLRLESGSECVGVMFINYRRPQTFDQPRQQLVNDFAFLATTSIINDRLVRQAMDFGELQRRDSLSVSVSEIITGLAHNSGNLFYGLSTYFAALDELVRKSKAESIDRKAVKGLVDRMREPITELAADFERIQTYRRIHEFKEESCQLEELIDAALEILRGKLERNRIMVKKVYARTPSVNCDKNQIQHLLLNLFINSLDAMGKRGTLSIGTEIDGDYNKIRITDTGPGIPTEHHSKLFQPYFTTKLGSGTGLGLSVSRYIAEAHGGHIEFRSRPGKGTSFFIYLPVGK